MTAEAAGESRGAGPGGEAAVPARGDLLDGLVMSWSGEVPLDDLLAAARRQLRQRAGEDVPAWEEPAAQPPPSSPPPSSRTSSSRRAPMLSGQRATHTPRIARVPGTPGGLRHASLESRVGVWNTPAQTARATRHTPAPAYTNLKPGTYLRFRTL
jgi:hypothetical protein